MADERNTKDYSQGKIYCIRNHINDDIYIGSTCQTLSQRMALHRYDSIKPKCQNTKIYSHMSENGRDNYYIELIEDYPCENTYQLKKREGELIREMKPALNINIPSRTNQEYRQEETEKLKLIKSKSNAKYRNNNSENIKQKKKEYREQNVEHIRQKMKEYRELNAEKIKQKKKEYCEQNAEKIKQKKREYYLRKKVETQNI